jgi:hypothetical protein
MSKNTGKEVVISWGSRSRNFTKTGSMEIPPDVDGKLRRPPIFGKKSLNNPEIRTHGDLIIVNQRTSLQRLPHLETTYLTRGITIENLSAGKVVEPVTSTINLLPGNDGIEARILLRPIVKRTTIRFYDSGTPTQRFVDVMIYRRLPPRKSP